MRVDLPLPFGSKNDNRLAKRDVHFHVFQDGMGRMVMETDVLQPSIRCRPGSVAGFSGSGNADFDSRIP